MIQEQFTIDDAAESVWDAVVIGAGPAGGLASLLLARHGFTTLLVERKTFPRDKVCGGCLNRRGIDVLERHGLRSVVQSEATSALQRIEVHGRGHGLTCSVKGSLAILRSEFDHRLASAAVGSGASFLSNAQAQVTDDFTDGQRKVSLTDRHGHKATARAKVVLACDGLSGTSLAQLDCFAHQVASRSRIGAGAVLDVDDNSVRANSLHMAIARDGYVGRMRLGDRRICLGAALERRAVRDYGVSGAICRVLTECHVENAMQYAGSRIPGTVPMTRKPRCTSRDNVFLVGDACGYVEPFTGEGMALALETAEAVVPLAIEAQGGGHCGLDQDWSRIIRKIAFRRRAVCRALSFVCRSPGLVDMTLATASRVPRLLESILAQINYLPHETQSISTWHSI